MITFAKLIGRVGPLCCLGIAAVLGDAEDAGAAAGVASLWDRAAPFPPAAEIRLVRDARYHLVQAQTPEYRFLHETRLAVHDGALHVVFSHNRKHCWLATIPVASLRIQ